jgi:hypothetical protein
MSHRHLAYFGGFCFETGSRCEPQASLELPLPPECFIAVCTMPGVQFGLGGARAEAVGDLQAGSVGADPLKGDKRVDIGTQW